MNTKKPQALVAGTVRNGGSKLTARIIRLNEILSRFFQIQWLVVESDSEDNTRHDLFNLSLINPNLRFVSMGTLKLTMPLRTQRIAHCRNHYVQELLNTKLYSHSEFLIVIDLDEVNDELNENSLLAVDFKKKWGAVFANQRGPYYDIWALRHDEWNPGDCWKQLEFLKSRGINETFAHVSAIASRMITLKPSNEWIRVESAFGGFGIYRSEYITPDISYEGIDQNGNEICEHVSFNNSIGMNGGEMYIIPNLVNCGEIPLTTQYNKLISTITNSN